MTQGWPMKWDKCPVCGSIDRLIESEVKDAKAAGLLGPDARIPAMAARSALFDPNPATPRVLAIGKRFPVIVSFFDVCAACGTLYCVEAHKQEGEAAMEFKPRQHP